MLCLLSSAQLPPRLFRPPDVASRRAQRLQRFCFSPYVKCLGVTVILLRQLVFASAHCVRFVTRSIVNELRLRVCLGPRLRSWLAFTYSTGSSGVGGSYRLVESQQLPAGLYGIDNHRC